QSGSDGGALYQNGLGQNVATTPITVDRQLPGAAGSESRSKTDRPRWIPTGESIEIAGFSVAGMVYVGPRGNSGPWQRENCLIDPSLPVAASDSDPSGESLGYWCSYSAIQPAARRSYLQWLASGRRDPEAGIGYVFLFFY